MDILWIAAVACVCLAFIIVIVWKQGRENAALDLEFEDAPDRPDSPRTVGGGRLLGVIVGVNKYRYSPSSNLNLCVNDARAVRLATMQFYGGSSRNIKVLLDYDATARNIKTALTNMVKSARPGDRCFFWYSGHGSQLPCSDEADWQMEILCPTDLHKNWDKNNVSDDFIAWVVAELAKKGVSLWMGADSCHSGDLTKGEGDASGNKRKFIAPPSHVRYTRKREAQPIRPTATGQNNLVFLAGCKTAEVSYEFAEKQHGALTYAFLEALKVHGAQGSADDLFEDIQQTVTAAFPQQHPQLEGSAQLAALPFLSPMPQENA